MGPGGGNTFWTGVSWAWAFALVRVGEPPEPSSLPLKLERRPSEPLAWPLVGEPWEKRTPLLGRAMVTRLAPGEAETSRRGQVGRTTWRRGAAAGESRRRAAHRRRRGVARRGGEGRSRRRRRLTRRFGACCGAWRRAWRRRTRGNGGGKGGGRGRGFSPVDRRLSSHRSIGWSSRRTREGERRDDGGTPEGRWEGRREGR